MTLYAQEIMTEKEIEKKMMEQFSDAVVIFTKEFDIAGVEINEEIRELQKMIKEELPTYLQTCIHETISVYLESRKNSNAGCLQ